MGNYPRQIELILDGDDPPLDKVLRIKAEFDALPPVEKEGYFAALAADAITQRLSSKHFLDHGSGFVN
jgi:hypothetical protein